MKSMGIIGEYNPFHQGHKYLIEQSKAMTESDICISVMSGDFVQRGTPAVENKWERAKTAIDNGVNLVVELPVIYACNSAEFFAKGAVGILEGFGAIDYLAFGSENGNVELLSEAANFLKENNNILHEKIRLLTSEGYSYPKARQIALEGFDTEIDISVVSQPNNILAVEYLKQVKNMKPLTIKRVGQGYHESASKIREALYNENPFKYTEIDKKYFEILCSTILQKNNLELEAIFLSGEGLGNKMKNEIRYSANREMLIERVKSKAYTYSRISRLLTQTILNITENDMVEAENYIRVLALDQKGAEFLKEVKKRENNKVPIITNINKDLKKYPQIKKTIEKDILASDIYNIITGKDLYSFSDYVMHPYIKK